MDNNTQGQQGWLVENDSYKVCESYNAKCVRESTPEDRQEDKHEEKLPAAPGADPNADENKHESSATPAHESFPLIRSNGTFRNRCTGTFECQLAGGGGVVGIAQAGLDISKFKAAVDTPGFCLLDITGHRLSTKAGPYDIVSADWGEEEPVIVMEIEVGPYAAHKITFKVNGVAISKTTSLDGTEFMFVCALNHPKASVRLSWHEAAPQTVLRRGEVDWNAVWKANRRALQNTGPINIGILGAIGSGKSSLINSFTTAMQPVQIDRVREPVIAQKQVIPPMNLQNFTGHRHITPAEGAVTQSLTRYRVQGTKVTCTDTWGWSNKGISDPPQSFKDIKDWKERDAAIKDWVTTEDAEIEKTLKDAITWNNGKGTIKNPAKQLPFLTEDQINSFVNGNLGSGAPLDTAVGGNFYRKPEKVLAGRLHFPLTERLHCLIICVPRYDALASVPQVRRIIEQTKGQFHRRIVAITKIDMLERPKADPKPATKPVVNEKQKFVDVKLKPITDFQDPVEKVYQSPELDTLIDDFAKLCMISVRDVLPVQLYSGQRTRHRIMDALTLDVLLSAVNHGMDYCEKYCDTHTPLGDNCPPTCDIAEKKNFFRMKVPKAPPASLETDDPVQWPALIANERKPVLEAMMDFLKPLGFSDANVRTAFVSANGDGILACKFLLQQEANVV